jgi:hypothetical protein
MAPIKTLFLYSRGAPTASQIIVDTVLRGFLNAPYQNPSPVWLDSMGWIGLKLKNRVNDPYAGLGYINDWLDAFRLTPSLNLIECNINDHIAYRRIKPLLKDIPLVVVMHSAAGDDLRLLSSTAHWFESRKGKLAVFLGNEYDLLEEKIDFIVQSGADYVCTQLPRLAAEFLYGDIDGAAILEMPHALNPSVYNPGLPSDRGVNIGFIGARYPKWIGDSERNDFLDHCNNDANVTGKVIKTGGVNIGRGEWANFLRNSYGTIGAEAGTYFLDKQGAILKSAKRAYSGEGIGVENWFEEILLKNKLIYVSGKAISSRHFEPMGTKTVQILLKGSYNDILIPDVHYFAVDKDLGNFEEKMLEFKDPYRWAEISNCAYEYAMDCHTYAHRLRDFVRSIAL